MCEEKEDVQAIRIKLNLTQEELAKKLNLSRQFICSVEKGVKNFSNAKMAELKKLYYAAFPHLAENTLKVELLQETNLKDFNKGIHSQDYTDYATFSGRLMKRTNEPNCQNTRYGSIIIDSDAMEPAIKKGSRVVFEYQKNVQIIDNEIYIFYYKNELFIRRISKNLTTYTVKADNKSYDDVILNDTMMKDMDIAGRVIAVIFN